MSEPSHPVTVTDEYLAAILAELRAIRAQREPEQLPGVVELREPERPKPKRKPTKKSK